MPSLPFLLPVLPISVTDTSIHPPVQIPRQPTWPQGWPAYQHHVLEIHCAKSFTCIFSLNFNPHTTFDMRHWYYLPFFRRGTWGLKREVKNFLRIVQSTNWKNLEENPGIAIPKPKGLSTMPPQPLGQTEYVEVLWLGREPGGGVSHATGWKFSLSLRKDQGRMETAVLEPGRVAAVTWLDPHGKGSGFAFQDFPEHTGCICTYLWSRPDEIVCESQHEDSVRGTYLSVSLSLWWK